MKKILIGLVCVVLTLPVAAQTITKKVDLSGFSRIGIDGAIDVTLVQSDRYWVEITYETPCKIEARLEGKKLILKSIRNNKNDRNTSRCTATVRMPELEWLSISGACSLTCEGRFESESFGLHASGACSVHRLNITATNADLDVSGACSVGFTGKIDTTRCNFSGASNIKMKLQSHRPALDVSGACKVEADLLCNVLKTKVSGAVLLNLNGKTDSMTIENLGASKIKATNLEATRANVEAAGASSTAVKVLGPMDVNLSGVCRMTYTGDPELGTVAVGKMCSLKKAD